MDLNRRQLFRFGAAATLTAAITPAAAALVIPTLWGDGVHDDSDGLEAGLNGKPVHVAGRKLTIVEGHLVGGIYTVSRTLNVGSVHLRIESAKIVAAPRFEGRYLMEVTDMKSVHLQNCELDARPCGGLASVMRVA